MWLERVTLRGFRAFVDPPQSVDLARGLNIVYADNSHGKTSFAEGLEFLLTGTISRRTFTGSTTREFSECLRNAHLAVPATFVEAVFVDAVGARHTLKRVLETDFTATRDCVTVLTLNGSAITDPSPLLTLSDPPLQTPILLQHSLRYVLSAKPQDRVTYFKAILDVTSLDKVYDSIIAVATSLETQPSVLQLRAYALLPASAWRADDGSITPDTVATALRAELRSSLRLPADVDGEDLELEARESLARQAETHFPFAQVELGQGFCPPLPTESLARLQAAGRVLLEGAATDAALLKLYDSAAALLPQALPDPLECPLCLDGSLSQVRVDSLRRALVDSREVRAADMTFGNERQKLVRWLDDCERYLATFAPRLVHGPEAPRVRASVQQAALSLLIGGEATSQLEAWLSTIASLGAAAAASTELIAEGRSTLAIASPDSITREEGLAPLVDLSRSLETLARVGDEYRTAFAPVRSHINGRLAAIGALSRPRELLALIPSVAELATDIATHDSRSSAVVALREAADNVRDASKRVLDAKFDALSDEIDHWWGLLRPDELSNFGGVHRAGSGRRYLDVKATLRPVSDAANAVERDAVAVFSDSQLNCLGLASFLARISRENSTFVVLDDPIQASDEEHRYTFVRAVPQALLSGGKQVVILTHDQRLARDLQDLYAHTTPLHVQIALDTPQAGSRFVALSDGLETDLTRAHHLSRSVDLDSRRRASQIVRSAAERFCKRILVESRRGAGDATALLSDYDGRTLDPLVAAATPVLRLDPSHPGKLRAIGQAMNPGNHDDGAPSTTALRVSIGDLRDFVRRYL